MHALPAWHILDGAGRNGRRAVPAVRRRHVSLVWRHLVRRSLRARDVCHRSALVLLRLPGVRVLRGMRRRDVLDRAERCLVRVVRSRELQHARPELVHSLQRWLLFKPRRGQVFGALVSLAVTIHSRSSLHA